MTTTQTTAAPATVRVLIALDVPAEQAADPEDLVESVAARVRDEAGYLDDGMPVMPVNVAVAVVEDSGPLTADDLARAYRAGRVRL